MFHILFGNLQAIFFFDFHHGGGVVKRIQPELQQWSIFITQVWLTWFGRLLYDLDDLFSNGRHGTSSFVKQIADLGTVDCRFQRIPAACRRGMTVSRKYGNWSMKFTNDTETPQNPALWICRL